MGKSGEGKFIGRKRPGRVRIAYPAGGNDTELPFTFGVMADFYGAATSQVGLTDRPFSRITPITFDDVMKAIGPRVEFDVPDVMAEDGSRFRVQLTFDAIDSFSPGSVARNLEGLRTVIASSEPLEPDVDKRLTDQINLVLHHPDFRRLESTWRGLHFLVNQVGNDELVKIKIVPARKSELLDTVRGFTSRSGALHPLLRMLHEETYGVVGGEPFGCIVGDYYFDHGPEDVELLSELATVCAAIHAPFIAGADPGVMGMNSWQELVNPRDLSQLFNAADLAAWRSLRESEDSRYLGLTMPRFLARLPYDPTNSPVEEFAFVEDAAGSGAEKYVWANAAFALAVNIARSFEEFGSYSRIRGVDSGGIVEGLPTHTFPTDDGGVDTNCPTEIAISDRREAELARNGFMPLRHLKGRNAAVFVSAPSLQRPAEFDDPDATGSASLSARLPYVLESSRFAHYLKCMVRDHVNTLMGPEKIRNWLNEWIRQYVEPDSAQVAGPGRARKPLAAAEVELEDIEGEPGAYAAKLHLRFSHQLEGLSPTLRLRIPLPVQGGQHTAPSIHDAQFTVYRPRAIQPSVWATILVFAHEADRPPGVPRDTPDPIEQVKEQAKRLLADKADLYRSSTQDSLHMVPEESELTFLPQVEGLHFNPGSRTFRWVEAVHREEFRVRADEGTAGQTLRGRMSVFLGSLLLSEINMTIRVTSGEVQDIKAGAMQEESARPYRKVFASYSHKDRELVEQCERLSAALGDRYLLDCRQLRTGEVWTDRIRSLIEDADVFQLFWSWNSLDSPFVTQEWRHALSLQRSNFIRPVYWQEPLPSRPENDIPPPELTRLHFQRLDVGTERREDRLCLSNQVRLKQSPSVDLSAVEGAVRELARASSTGELDGPRLKALTAGLLNGLTSGADDIEISRVEQKGRDKPKKHGRESEQIPRGLTTRPRTPRVQIEYDAEVYGASERIELPFVVGVMAELSGPGTESRPALADRQFMSIDPDNFDERLAAMTSHLVFDVPNVLAGEGELSVDLAFSTMDSFSPVTVARQVDALRVLLDIRQSLSGSSPADLALITELDKTLSRQLNLVLHHPEFQRLERTWRGLHYLVSHAELDAPIWIRVLDVSKSELYEALAAHRAADRERSPIFTKIYEQELAQFGGEPYGCIVGDYYFDHSSPDVELLAELSETCAAAGAPFISGASPGLYGAGTWKDVMDVRDIDNATQSAEHAAWRVFRDSHESRYIGLCAPRIMIRAPYGPEALRVEEFDFQEDIADEDGHGFTWANSAFLMATNMVRSFFEDGWCANIQGMNAGGTSAALAHHASIGPLEVRATDRQEALLSRDGVNFLLQLKNSDRAVFVTASSLHGPSTRGDLHAATTETLTSRFSHLLPVCRVAHYLAVLARSGVGRFRSDREMLEWLDTWLTGYVELNPETAAAAFRAQKPLSFAKLELHGRDPRSSTLTARLTIIPHFLRESLSAPLCVQVILPSVDQGVSPPVETGELSVMDSIAASVVEQVRDIGPGLIEAIDVPSPGGTGKIELHRGDLTELAPEDRCDVLIVSAFPDDYAPTASSLVGALDRKGISLGKLAADKYVDLRDSFSCWLSQELPQGYPGIEFNRVLCFEPLHRGASAPQVVGDIFRSLAPFIGGAPRVSSVAMPVVAAGNQGYEIAEMLPPLLDAAAHWLEAGLPLQAIKIYVRDEQHAIRAHALFKRFKDRLGRKGSESIADGSDFDVFVSYSHEDPEPAYAMADRLKGQGLRVFIDKLELDGGMSWQSHIFETLDRCRRVVAVYSPSYVTSKICQEEFNIAWARGRKLSTDLILPVYWQSAQLPTYMEMLHYIDCRERQTAKLTQACSALLDKL